jgi:hypothetical protein
MFVWYCFQTTQTKFGVFSIMVSTGVGASKASLKKVSVLVEVQPGPSKGVLNKKMGSKHPNEVSPFHMN